MWALALWQRPKSSHRRGGRAGPAGFGGSGACLFLVGIWGLAAKEWDSLVPACTSSSIFCEKHSSGVAGEREKLSGERGCCSGVIGGCNMLSWLPWLFSRKSSLGAESSSSSDMAVCGELCVQGSAEIVSVSRGCCGGVVLSCPFCC